MRTWERKEVNEFISVFKEIAEIAGIDADFTIGDSEIFIAEIKGKGFIIQIRGNYDFFYSGEQLEENFEGLEFYISILDENEEKITVTNLTKGIPVTSPSTFAFDFRETYTKDQEVVSNIMFVLLGGHGLYDPAEIGPPYALIINQSSGIGKFVESNKKKFYHDLLSTDLFRPWHNELFEKQMMVRSKSYGGPGYSNFSPK